MNKKHPMKTLKLVFGIATGLILSSSGLVSGLRAAEGDTTNVTVVVLLFSGRPNPTWQLQAPQLLAALKEKLKALPEASKAAPAGWSRKGFAGFRIRDGSALGIPGEIRVYQGVIKTGQDEAAIYLKDSIGLEQSLINESKQQALEQKVKDAIASYESARKAVK